MSEDAFETGAVIPCVIGRTAVLRRAQLDAGAVRAAMRDDGVRLAFAEPFADLGKGAVKLSLAREDRKPGVVFDVAALHGRLADWAFHGLVGLGAARAGCPSRAACCCPGDHEARGVRTSERSSLPCACEVSCRTRPEKWPLRAVTRSVRPFLVSCVHRSSVPPCHPPGTADDFG